MVNFCQVKQSYESVVCIQSFRVMAFQLSFFKWHGIAADRNQWRAVCGSKIPSATKETPTSSRKDIWAELRYGTVLS
jgi:hypothetical protein